MVLQNRVLGWGQGEDGGVASLDRLIAAYGTAGFGIELSAHAATTEAIAALRERRFRRIAAAHVLARDARDPPARYLAWAQGTGLAIERAAAHQVAELAALLGETFQLPAAARELLVHGTAGAAWRRWVVLDGRQVVGSSLSHVHEGIAWFGWTAVRPSHRGRWVPTGILARQLEEAAQAGCRYVTTETAPSTLERPDAAYLNLKRFGFLDCYLRWSYLRAPTRSDSSAASGASRR
jgi:GNAT superfamily N-acetyltransferase